MHAEIDADDVYRQPLKLVHAYLHEPAEHDPGAYSSLFEFIRFTFMLVVVSLLSLFSFSGSLESVYSLVLTLAGSAATSCWLFLPCRRTILLLALVATAHALPTYGHERDPQRYPPEVVIRDDHPFPGDSNIYHEQPPQATTDIPTLMGHLTGEDALPQNPNMEYAYGWWVYDPDWTLDGLPQNNAVPVPHQELREHVELGMVRNWYRSERPVDNPLLSHNANFNDDDELMSESDEDEEDPDLCPYCGRPPVPGAAIPLCYWCHLRPRRHRPSPSA